MAYISFDPYRQCELGRWDSWSDEKIGSSIEATHAVWNKWRTTSVQERVVLLEKLAARLGENRHHHASIMTSEMGKPVTQALAEVDKCAALCSYYAENLHDFLIPEVMKSTAGNCSVRLDPQGIVFGIMPWNYPYWQVFRYVVPALAGGNAAILKHASNVTMCATAIENVIAEAGFPGGLFRVILPGHSQIEKIISMPEVRGVTLTGSNNAGSAVASYAGRYIKKTVLELGGSDPFIVFADADISDAVAGAVTGRFQNCGQSCIAAKRFLVQNEIMPLFISEFVSAVGSLKMGDPADPDVFIGPMVNTGAASEIEKQVADSIAMGALVNTGGKRSEMGPAFYEPTILTSPPPHSPVMVEEVFGPVAPVTGFNTLSEALSVANGSRFGLGASVWTRDEQAASEAVALLDTGNVAVNGFVRSDPATPFGGVKDSGYGRELSFDGFSEFLNRKSVTWY